MTIKERMEALGLDTSDHDAAVRALLDIAEREKLVAPAREEIVRVYLYAINECPFGMCHAR